MISLLNLNSAPGLLFYHIHGPWKIITRPPFNTWINLTLAIKILELWYTPVSLFLFVSLTFCLSLFLNSSLVLHFPSGYENEAQYFILLISSYLILKTSFGINLIYLIGYYVIGVNKFEGNKLVKCNTYKIKPTGRTFLSYMHRKVFFPYNKKLEIILNINLKFSKCV